MTALSLLSAVIAATTAAPAPQADGTTQRHDDHVRLARPGDEGPLRYGPPAVATLSNGPSTQTRRHSRSTGGSPRAVSYDVATGIETLIDVDDSLDLSRWVSGSKRLPGTEDGVEGLAGWTSDLGAISNESFPWSAQCRIVGRDINGVQFEVSGTLIDARHVITCGHCVHGGAGGTWHNSITVYPSWDGDSDAFGSAFGTSYTTFTGWVNNSDPADDVGFIRLDRPVGFLTDWFGYGFETNDSFFTSNFFNLAAYPDASSCYAGAPDQLYYGFGIYDSVTSGLLHADTVWSCGAKGMDGGGAYAILGGERFIYATHRLFDTSATFDLEDTRLSSTHVDFYDNTFRPGGYPSTDPDYVPLGVKVDMGGDSIAAGETLVSMDYLVGNASLFDPVGTQTHAVEVYLSTNNNISTFDTLIQTHYFDHDFEAIGSHRISVAVPPTIPSDTPSGNYWIGIITKSYDTDSSNNDTDGADAFPIVVEGCRVEFKQYGIALPGSGGYAPVFYGTGDGCEAGGHSVHLAGALGGARGTLWVGFAEDDIPTWGGNFYVDLSGPFFTFNIKADGPDGVPGAGSFTLPGGDVRELAGISLFTQISLIDPGAIRGISLTNGLELVIHP